MKFTKQLYLLQILYINCYTKPIFLLQLRRIRRQLAAGLNPQIQREVGGADTSATKFALMPRLIPRRGFARQSLLRG